MGPSSKFASEARRQAAHILSQPPFRSPRTLPDPLAGVFRAIGQLLSDAIGRPIAWLWDHLVHGLHLVFGALTPVVVVVAAVALGAVLALVRRRSLIGRREDVAAHAASEGDSPASLEAASLEAERRGELDTAVRLRFRAGLGRLESAGIIASHLVATTHQVRRALDDPTFDDLARCHEEIAYAGRQAAPADAAAAREGWARLLAQVRARPAPSDRPTRPVGSVTERGRA